MLSMPILWIRLLLNWAGNNLEGFYINPCPADENNKPYSYQFSSLYCVQLHKLIWFNEITVFMENSVDPDQMASYKAI